MLGHLTNFKHKDFFLEITLFDSSVMIVDKTRIGKDVHENNDIIDIHEPGPASDVIENKREAFEFHLQVRRDLVLTLLKKRS